MLAEDTDTQKDSPLSSKGGRKNIKDKKRDKRGRDGDLSGEESLEKERSFQTSGNTHQWVCGEPWDLRGQHNQEEK